MSRTDLKQELRHELNSEQAAQVRALLRKTKGYRAVGFDVFGTLLHRDVGAPTDLFRLMGQTFYEKRTAAEAAARAAHSGEVTLEEIYAQPCLNGYSPADECAAELRSVVADAALLAAARLCHESGQRVIAISDMYLPPEQLAAMLRRCGFDFLDGVYVSSAYGVQKRSGRLFRRVLAEMGLRAGDLIFVGDDWRADCLGAALCGVRAVHCGKPVYFTAESWQGRAADAFAANRLPGCASGQEALGYRILGPLLVAFTDWLHTARMAAPERPLLFLARDMHLVYRLYRERYPEDANTAYLCVSRRSLCPELLAEERYDLLWAALPRQRLTGAEIAAYCGADCPPTVREESFDLKAEASAATVAALLRTLRPKAGGSLQDYLKRTPLCENAYLADIGSGGTTQRLLEALCGVALHGLYLACDARLATALPAERTEVFLFDGKPAPRSYWAGQAMLERLLSEESGSVWGYHGGVPLRGDAPTGPSVAAFQTGAECFVHDWQHSALVAISLPPADAIAPFLRLVDAPSTRQADLLGDVQVEDGGVWALAAPRRAAEYVKAPKLLAADFAAARWKVGYLRRLIRLPLPYGAAYRLLKR